MIDNDTQTKFPDGSIVKEPQALEHNINEFSVGDIANAIKRTLEGAFGRVRVRGEVSRPNYHGSGHLYFTLKDEDAAIDGVCWRGSVGKLGLKLEEGMDIICSGRISSYPRSSKYQIVIDSVELAGEGALLKLLEDRRKKLTAEGLFDPEKKKPLPFLPNVIGVITSPTGAVIRDILHRLSDRFPRRVILWPVMVQGEGAAAQIASAIKGFNVCHASGDIPKPDLLIVARGGGSLEDLWSFNEEIVVRAAAESNIPLISAVGHETDTTLIDFSSDVRAPTPTAAAEMAVPVRAELEAQVLQLQQRLNSGLERSLEDMRLRLQALVRGLPQPDNLLEESAQRLDRETDHLKVSATNRFNNCVQVINSLNERLRHPYDVINYARERLSQTCGRLNLAISIKVENCLNLLGMTDPESRLQLGISRIIKANGERLGSQSSLLESLSYKGVLGRGFALVRDSAGKPVIRAVDAAPGETIKIEFSDGTRGAIFDDDDGVPKSKLTPKRPSSKKSKSSSGGSQGSLL